MPHAFLPLVAGARARHTKPYMAMTWADVIIGRRNLANPLLTGVPLIHPRVPHIRRERSRKHADPNPIRQPYLGTRPDMLPRPRHTKIIEGDQRSKLAALFIPGRGAPPRISGHSRQIS